jgi:hypothetical protein
LHASIIDNQYFAFASTFHPRKPLSMLLFFGAMAKASLYIDNSNLERLGQPSSTHSRRNLLRGPSPGTMASSPKRRLLVVLCIALLVKLPWWSISTPRITVDLGKGLPRPRCDSKHAEGVHVSQIMRNRSRAERSHGGKHRRVRCHGCGTAFFTAWCPSLHVRLEMLGGQRR